MKKILREIFSLAVTLFIALVVFGCVAFISYNVAAEIHHNGNQMIHFFVQLN